jgi:hypothetical protein
MLRYITSPRYATDLAPTVEQLRDRIIFLRLVQRPVGWLFWEIESLIAKIDNEIERRLSA